MRFVLLLIVLISNLAVAADAPALKRKKFSGKENGLKRVRVFEVEGSEQKNCANDCECSRTCGGKVNTVPLDEVSKKTGEQSKEHEQGNEKSVSNKAE